MNPNVKQRTCVQCGGPRDMRHVTAPANQRGDSAPIGR